MAKYKLFPYKIRLMKDEKEIKDYTKIKLKDNSVINISELLYLFITQYCKKTFDSKEKMKTARFNEVTLSKNKHQIYGRLQVGDYGLETDFFDIKFKKTKPRARVATDSEEYPLFFLTHVSKSNSVYLILFSFKQFGGKTIFSEAFDEFLNEKTDVIYSRITPLIQKELIDEYIKKNKIVELKFIKRKVPKDIADKACLKNPDDVFETHSFKAKKNKELFLKTKNSYSEIAENVKYWYYEITQEKYDLVKAVIENEGSRKTVSLTKQKFRESMDLKKTDLTIDNSGFPTTSSLFNNAKIYMKDIFIKNGEESVVDANI